MVDTVQVQMARGIGTRKVVAAQGVTPNSIPVRGADGLLPQEGMALPQLGVLTETIAVAAFTDGGGTSGTYELEGSIPAGAILLPMKMTPVAGFTGDVSAACTVGDGSDADRYMTGTPSVFATDADGVECGVVSGSKLVKTENHPVVTITSATDFALVIAADAGILRVSIPYILPE